MLAEPDLAADAGRAVGKRCDLFREAMLVFSENDQFGFGAGAISEEVDETADCLEGHSRRTERFADFEQLDVRCAVDAVAAFAARDGPARRPSRS
jgi:hypothetical protein